MSDSAGAPASGLRAATPWRIADVRGRAADYLALTKPRVVVMVLLTTLVGFYLGSDGTVPIRLLLHTLFGTALAAGGTLALNQYLEHDLDGRMERTRHRPLPAGRLVPMEALLLGLVLLVAGLAHLAAAVNGPAALVTSAIAVSYLLIYTPLKPVTSLCALVGAVPGALPPVAGWVAARGGFGFEAVVLFAIMYLWQVPHTLAIGSLYRSDYARAGIRVLPAIEGEGLNTAAQSVLNCLALLSVTLLPTLLGMAGSLYFVTALVLGTGFLWAALGLARTRSTVAARRLLVVSLVYLPVLLGMMAVDKVHIAP